MREPGRRHLPCLHAPRGIRGLSNLAILSTRDSHSIFFIYIFFKVAAFGGFCCHFFNSHLKKTLLSNSGFVDGGEGCPVLAGLK